MSDLRLHYDAPATVWTEALPLGNGRLGAMVFGGVGRERLQLNEDTFWAGGPYAPTNPRALSHLSEVRELLFAHRFTEAEALANLHLMAEPLKQMPYQPVADLWIDMNFAEPVDQASYQRSLEIDHACSITRFGIAGTTFERETFITAADGVLVMRISASSPGALALRVSLTSENAGTLEIHGANSLRLVGRNRQAEGIPGMLSFAAEIRIAGDGHIQADRSGIEVSGATEISILLDCGTSFRRFDDVGGDPVALVAARLDKAALLNIDQLRERHLADYLSLFDRLSIDLGESPAVALSTDQRIAANSAVPDPSLVALYVQYGRYLMISSSRIGTQPANLQGIWNDLIEPPWGSKYTCNINLQMNYWLADPANLGECMEPLLRLVEDVAITGRETARVQYNAPGWVLHHNTDLWRATAPIDGAQWGLWPIGGAWLCAQLWDHLSFGGDRSLVERLYPLMVGAAEFIAHVLVPLPGTDLLVTAPSLSPENIHPHGAALCYGPAMDSQVISDLFDAVTKASEQLGRDAPLRERLMALKSRLPTHRIGTAGQLQEWSDDWDMQVPEIHHRHVSHLYAVYPSYQINPDDTPELANAARRALDIRGDDATGWGLGWRINLWARLRDGDRAFSVVQRLLSPERTYPNMFDAHPPFQIDGNFGGAAGVIEMLVQSRNGLVHLLPALPSAWPSGSVEGVRARGGIMVDLTWLEGRVTRAILRSPQTQSVRLRVGDDVHEIAVGPHTVFEPKLHPDRV